MRISDWSSDVCSSDLHRARQRVLADAERDEALLQQDFTGMDVGEGGHRSSPAVSVVIDDLHVVRIAAAPAEADSPLVVDPEAAANGVRRLSMHHFPTIHRATDEIGAESCGEGFRTMG